MARTKMTSELANRLIRQILAQEKPGFIPAKVAVFFKLTEKSEKLPVRMIVTNGDAKDFLAMAFSAPTPDDLVAVRRMPDNAVSFYLTSRTWRLRAAASWVSGEMTPLRNEDAEAEFQDCIAHLAFCGKALPPDDVK